MKKIPTIFVRDTAPKTRRVTPVLTPGCEWIIEDGVVATRKRDGTAVMVNEDGSAWKRYDAKHGKSPPERFIACQDPDPAGHWPGWVPVRGGTTDDMHLCSVPWPKEPGTYEFCGPKVNGNPERVAEHTFFKHGAEPLSLFLLQTVVRVAEGKEVPATESPELLFKEVLTFLHRNPIEGVVWHHPDGRMAKIKSRDFGLPWPVKP